MRQRQTEPKWLRVRHGLLLTVLILVAQSACGQRPTSGKTDQIPPSQFSDKNGNWERSNQSLSESDTQQISRFFDRNPDLLDSPDWTGQPEKYVCKDSQSLLRFYWFSGSDERPSWNALEMEGTRIRSISGEGVPGDSIEINN